MIGILIATHGELSKGLVDAVELIMGEQEKIDTVSLKHGDDITGFGEKIKEKIEQLDNGKGVLVFTDIFGASPFNQSAQQKRTLESIEFRIISGVNLPMLLEVISLRDNSIADVYAQLIQTGKESIKDFDEEMANS